MKSQEVNAGKSSSSSFFSISIPTILINRSKLGGPSTTAWNSGNGKGRSKLSEPYKGTRAGYEGWSDGIASGNKVGSRPTNQAVALDYRRNVESLNDEVSYDTTITFSALTEFW
jgi:hypothetical protein